MEKKEKVMRNTKSKRSTRVSNLIKLIEKKGGNLSSKQWAIEEAYNKEYGKTDIINQTAISNILKANQDIFEIKGDELRLSDYTKQVDSIRERFAKCKAKLGSLETYVIHTTNNAHNLLAIIRRTYKSQIIEAKIINNDIYLTIEYLIDYSSNEMRELNDSDLGSVLRFLDYTINETGKKK